ncbi:MAG: site-specific DNA-methyltransferase, partial [Candidatus Pacebacteria bacterium]|nr:site-specific DNA-methyltransferase [Candidatus Paceibacterota bacterium]
VMLLNDDCLVAMQKLIDDGVQVDSIVTDPPYHLQSIVDRFGKEDSAPAQFGTDGAFKRASTGFMGQEWDGGDIAFRKETWELALKLLKPGGHLLAFSASRNYHRMAVAIEDAGFEIRDQLMWLYGSGFPKSLNIGKGVEAFNKTGKTDTVAFRQTRMGENYKPTGQKEYYKGRAFSAGDEVIDEDGIEQEINNEWKGWGTALKPAHEPIVMARKLLSESNNVANVLKHGTGGINIDGCRVDYVSDYDKKHQADIARGQDNADNGVFFGGKGKTKASTHEPTGRFPANVMHDGSEEVVSGFPNTKSTKGNPRTASIKNQTRLNNSEEVFVNCEYDDEGSAARFFYCPKVSKSERGENNTHPTVKPQELMKYLCRLVTPKGGTVLDPFMGSGSTGMACKDEGFEFIGIEREKEYFEIAEKRINSASPLMEFM